MVYYKSSYPSQTDRVKRLPLGLTVYPEIFETNALYRICYIGARLLPIAEVNSVYANVSQIPYEGKYKAHFEKWDKPTSVISLNFGAVLIGDLSTSSGMTCKFW